ncbi:hypothetical protein GGR58DRAFT_472484 [Xylaria digitata]|nr:hypothetical protein GGR58DRAFT_472484 [Xylaria digitata]
MSKEKKLPKTPADWKHESQLLAWKSIHEYGLACSGSEISREQFLLLRTLWVPRTVKDLCERDRSLWIDDSSFQKAQDFLSSSAISTAWKRFLNSIGTPLNTLQEKGYADLHTFSLVRYHQAQSEGLLSGRDNSAKVDMSPIAKRTRNQLKQRVAIQSSPTPAPNLLDLEEPMEILDISDPPPSGLPSTPERGNSPAPYETPGDVSSPFEDPRVFKAIQDEQIVNTALIEYLNALAIHCTDVKADWTLHRLPLIARDHEGVKTYEARVDGYLKRRLDEQPSAIIEVKPFDRDRKEVPIRMQESAQMASWINHYPPPNMSQLRGTKQKIRRLLISQDRHLIYLNFAEFDAKYVDYICDKDIDLDADSFLVMKEYGPFSVGSRSNMLQLGELVLGYALGESKKNIAKS